MADRGLALFDRNAPRPVAVREPAVPILAEAAQISAADWRALAAETAADNVFFGPEVLPAAIAAFDPAARVAAVRGGDGSLLGLAPLHRTRLGRIAPAVAVFTHDFGPLGAVLHRADAADIAAAGLLRDAAAMAGSGAALLLPALPAAAAFAAAIVRTAEAAGRRVLAVERSARAMLDRVEHPLAPRAALATRRRKEYARQWRRLGDLGATEIAMATEPDAIEAAFVGFLALEAAGWKGRNGSALAQQPAALAFARTAVANLARAGRVRILSLRVGGRDAAILVCLLAGGTATTWKIAYDERLGAFSPGAQLMLEAPPRLFAEPGIVRIDSLAAPNHPMIDHLWPGRLELVTLAVSPSRGRTMFRLGLLGQAAETRARALARALRSRLKSRRRPKTQGVESDEPSAA